VVFVDLEGDEDELQDIQHSLSHHALTSQRLQKLKDRHGQFDYPSADDRASDDQILDLPAIAERKNPNINGFSAALSCYPSVRLRMTSLRPIFARIELLISLHIYSVVKSLSGHLDLNDLHSLSRTCRQFRSNLLQYHRQLLKQSLRCVNDSQPLLAEVLHGNANSEMTAADIAAVLEALDFEFETLDEGRKVLTGKIGQCARDLVGKCRKCGVVACRNCAVKPPSNSSLRGRYRRLCAGCKEAPLWMHTLPLKNVTGQRQLKAPSEGIASSSSSTRSFHTSSSASSVTASAGNWRHGLTDGEPLPAFTAPAFEHGPCTCATRGVYLCQACGQSLRSADTTYKRVWTWRSRYSTHIGGLGTGMGEGDQGQKCGRGEDCLDAVEGEVEIDCSERPASLSSPGPRTTDSDSAQKSEAGLSAGYLRQEVEGIGGVVKKKVKKRIRVGATVWEFDDERGSGKYLEREASGRERSWCGWCGRIVKGQRDREVHGDDCFMI
jgi:hypothetical protein